MEEWMWDQVLLTRDANLTVKKATPSGNPTILYQLILPHLVLRGVSCECKRRVDEMLFRYLPAQLHTWKFSPVLFFADEVRSHADLKPPYQIKSRAMDLGACSIGTLLSMTIPRVWSRLCFGKRHGCGTFSWPMWIARESPL